MGGTAQAGSDWYNSQQQVPMNNQAWGYGGAGSSSGAHAGQAQQQGTAYNRGGRSAGDGMSLDGVQVPTVGTGNQGYSTNQYDGADDGAMNNKNRYRDGTSGPEDYSNEPPLLEELGIHFDHIWFKTLTVIYFRTPQAYLSQLSKMGWKAFITYFFTYGRVGAEGLASMMNGAHSGGINVNVKDTLLNPRDLDEDIIGPIMYCIILGTLMLLQGKVNFGYIYGFSLTCSLSLHRILLLLQNTNITPSAIQQQQMGNIYANNSASPSKGTKIINTSDEAYISIWETCSILGYSLIPVLFLAAISILISLKGILGVLLSISAILWSTYSATRLFDVKMSLDMNNQKWLVAYPVALLYACFTLITVF